MGIALIGDPLERLFMSTEGESLQIKLKIFRRNAK